MEEKSAKLWEVYCKTNDMKLLCENLYSEYREIAGDFTTEYYFSFTENHRREFVNVLSSIKINMEKFPIITNIAAAIINIQTTDECLHQLLKNIILTAKSKSTFPKYKCKSLNTYLLAKTDVNILTIDYSSWSRKELEKFKEFLLETYRQLGTKFKCKDQLEKWLEKYNFTQLSFVEEKAPPTKKTPATKKTAVAPVVAINEFKDLFEKMFDNKINGLMAEIATTKNELQKFNQSIFAKNDLLELYAEKLQVKEQELFAIKKMLMEQEKVIAELQVAKSKVNKNDNQYKAEIEDLKSRLKASFQADDITKKQDLITLKKNIGAALKLRYDKFNENQDAVCNEDNYEVLRASIHQIFRVLKRYGIEL